MQEVLTDITSVFMLFVLIYMPIHLLFGHKGVRYVHGKFVGVVGFIFKMTGRAIAWPVMSVYRGAQTRKADRLAEEIASKAAVKQPRNVVRLRNNAQLPPEIDPEQGVPDSDEIREYFGE